MKDFTFNTNAASQPTYLPMLLLNKINQALGAIFNGLINLTVDVQSCRRTQSPVCHIFGDAGVVRAVLLPRLKRLLRLIHEIHFKSVANGLA